METFIVVLIVIVAVLLGLIVLIQNPKGGGLATGFTGANQIGGVKRTTDFLEKATWTLAVLLLVLSITATGLEKASVGTVEGLENSVETEQPVLPAQQDNSIDPNQGTEIDPEAGN